MEEERGECASGMNQTILVWTTILCMNAAAAAPAAVGIATFGSKLLIFFFAVRLCSSSACKNRISSVVLTLNDCSNASYW